MSYTSAIDLFIIKKVIELRKNIILLNSS